MRAKALCWLTVGADITVRPEDTDVRGGFVDGEQGVSLHRDDSALMTGR